MSKQSIFLWVVCILMVGFSQNLAAQTKTTAVKEQAATTAITDAADAPEGVQNKVSKQPIRSLKPTVKQEVKGLKAQLAALKKIEKPNPFILKKINHLEQLLVSKQKQQATTPDQQ